MAAAFWSFWFIIQKMPMNTAKIAIHTNSVLEMLPKGLPPRQPVKPRPLAESFRPLLFFLC